MKARKAKKKGARKAPRKQKRPDVRPAEKLRTLTCKAPGCGNTWQEPVRAGRIREFCLERCSDPSHRERDLNRLRDRGEDERAARIEEEERLRDLRLEHAARPLRLAMALSVSDDRKLVAAVAGVDPEDPELEELLEEAERLFPGIAEGRPTELQRLYQMAVGQAGISMLMGAHQLGPARAPLAIKQGMQAIALAQSGGASRTFGRFEIVLRGLGDEGGDA